MLGKFIVPLSLIALTVLGATACNHSGGLDRGSETTIPIPTTTSIPTTNPPPTTTPNVEDFNGVIPDEVMLAQQKSPEKGCLLFIGDKDEDEGEAWCWRDIGMPHKSPVSNVDWVGTNFSLDRGCLRPKGKTFLCWRNLFEFSAGNLRPFTEVGALVVPLPLLDSALPTIPLYPPCDDITGDIECGNEPPLPSAPLPDECSLLNDGGALCIPSAPVEPEIPFQGTPESSPFDNFGNNCDSITGERHCWN